NIHFISIDNIHFSNKAIYYKKLLSDNFTVIQFNSIKFLIVNKEFPTNINSNQKLIVDYIIMTDNANVKIIDLVNIFSTRKIIIDSSNDFKHAQKWTDQCKNLGIPCHYTNTDGFFKQKI
ncbi:hypothetical protein ACFLTE_07565, partial [Bacteroidota bacterium]